MSNFSTEEDQGGWHLLIQEQANDKKSSIVWSFVSIAVALVPWLILAAHPALFRAVSPWLPTAQQKGVVLVGVVGTLVVASLFCVRKVGHLGTRICMREVQIDTEMH